MSTRLTSTSPNVIAARHRLWAKGELRWKLHEAQLKIYNVVRGLPRRTREALLFCARRFGKSFLGVIMALEDCLKNPGVQVAIVGPSLKQTKKIVNFLMRRITADAPQGLVTPKVAEASWVMANGSILMLGGFDTIAESFRGLDLFSIYLEESAQATADIAEFEYLLDSILMPTMMHSRGRLHHLTTPSRIVDHPVHVSTLPRCKLDGSYFEFTIEDNPLLSKADIEEEIEKAGGRGSIACDRELFVKIRRDETITVVPTFSEERHVSAVEPSHPLKYMVSGDLGYTNDLSVFHLAGYDHNIGKTIVLQEKSFPPETPSSVMVEALKEWIALKPTFVVDIQGNTRTDLSSLGLSTTAPIKDKFDSTVTFIRNEFYNDRLAISPECKLTVETLRSGTFNKKKTDFARTKVLGHLDALMSLVYLQRSVDRTTDLRPKPDPTKIWTPPPPPSSLERLSYAANSKY